MKKHSTLVIALFVSVFAAAGAFAQGYPFPSSSPGTEVPCTAAACPQYPNWPTPAYQLPIKTFTGRFLDSNRVSNFQAGSNLRTLRARGVTVAPELDKIYVVLGQGLAAYKMSTFFTNTLKQPLAQVGGNIYRGAIPYYEQYAQYDWYAYAEAKSSGWFTVIADGQDRLFDSDYDTRGNVYLAYGMFGWGIVRDANGQLVSQVRGEALNSVGTTKILTFTNGNRFYALLGSGLTKGVWDTTNAQNPSFLRKFSTVELYQAKAPESRMVALSGLSQLEIYSYSTLAGGGSPVKTFEPDPGYSFQGVASDGIDFYVAMNKGSDMRIARIATATMTMTSQATGITFTPRAMTFGGSILTVEGTDASGILDIRLLRLENGVPRHMDLGSYIKKFYFMPPANYAKPEGHTGVIKDSRVIRYGGKDYLMHSQNGMGDVYELQTRDNINIEQIKAFHGTDNPYSTTRGQGLYYGDPVRFRTSNSGATQEQIRFNFDNPEAPTGPAVEVMTGTDVDYQFVGAKTDSAIERTRSVRAEATNDPTNNSTAAVTMKVPSARIGVLNSSLLFTQPNASAAATIVVGDQFVDASDGSKEGHYSVWSLDGGVPTFARPDVPQPVGGCGARSLTFEAHYVPYIESTTLTPKYSDTFALIRTIPIGYTVRPFAAAVQIGTPAGGVIPFLNKTAVGSLASFALGSATPVTVKWELLDGAGAPLLTDTRSLTIAGLASDKFDVSATLVPSTGGSVRLSLSVADADVVDAACKAYISSTAQVAVKAPDPKITITTCTNVGSPCKFTAGSVSGADMSGWTFAWKIDGVVRSTAQVFDMGANSKNYMPEANKPYAIELSVTNAIASRSATQSITLQQALCDGAPKLISIVWVGTKTGCTSGTCTSNEPVQFKPQAYMYTIQECDEFQWTFGDGGTSNEREPVHTFSSNGPFNVSLVVKNSDGQTTASTTVTFGVVEPPPPPPPGCPTKAPDTVYITFRGNTSGCGTGGVQCVTNETVTFTAEFLSYNLQSCDTVSWNFGNGKTGSGKTASTTYTGQNTYTASVVVRNSKGEKSRTTQVVVNSTPTPTCPSQAPAGNLGLEWKGKTSGCTTGGANCLPGETVDFQLWVFGYVLQACDTIEWNFGDGQTTTTTKELLKVSHTYASSIAGGKPVSATIKNSKGTKATSEQIYFGATGDCGIPVINITGPGRAGVGKAVTFGGSVAPSTIEVVEWTWNFGPGQTKQGQSVSHTFGAPGTYDVKLTVRTGCAKEESKVLRVVVADNSFAYLLPAVAHLELPSGTWKTDVQIFLADGNLSSQPIDVTVEWNGQTKNMKLESSTVIYEDFMKAAFPEAGNMASGAVIIRGASDVVPQIWTRTYIVPISGQGSYGQLIPAIQLDDAPGAVTDPPSHILAGLQSSGKANGYRTNIGIVNPTNKLQNVTVALYDDQGFPVAEFVEVVNPYTLNQVNARTKLPSNWNDDNHYSAKITTATGDPVFAYASTVDNTSNDPVYQPAVADASITGEAWRRQVLVGVGHFNTWRSDVTIFNADGGPIQIDLRYYDQSGVKLAEALGMVIPARSFKHIEGLLRAPDLTPAQTADSYGTLYVETRGTVGKFPMVFGRTYNDLEELGTYGQGIAAFASATPNVTSAKAAVIPGVRAERQDPENKGYYTNVGFLNLTDQSTQVKISLLDEISGNEIGTETFTLSPNQTFIRPHVIEAEHVSATRGSIKVQVLSGGPVWAFASIIDNKTKDAEYVPAVPLP